MVVGWGYQVKLKLMLRLSWAVTIDLVLISLTCELLTCSLTYNMNITNSRFYSIFTYLLLTSFWAEPEFVCFREACSFGWPFDVCLVSCPRDVCRFKFPFETLVPTLWSWLQVLINDFHQLVMCWPPTLNIDRSAFMISPFRYICVSQRLCPKLPLWWLSSHLSFRWLSS